ncbi:MAG: amino acid permease [Caulobacteraceae bacterium]|nr:amino acid permease [Caulobacteraceae bacterium]
MHFLNRRKSFDLDESIKVEHRLKRTLDWRHLVAMGVGAIIGTGIYTLTGVGAGLAGPAVILSFMIAGAVCACAALCYAEMSTLMPAAGSAYAYTYAVLGELPAWVVGWSLILEYTVVCSAVAVGWSGYFVGAMKSVGVNMPTALTAGIAAGGLVNLPAVVITLAVCGLLVLGTKESARLNLVLVAIKLIALGGFLVLTLPVFHPSHFHPFMPNGFIGHEGPEGKVGVMTAASLIFFAFYGFDAISTASEEAKNPQRDLKIGIMGSMLLCTTIYIVVALAAIGASRVEDFSKSVEPLAFILRMLGHPFAAVLIGGAAVIALPSVIMVFMYGQSRVFFAMARDGLLPVRLARVHPKFGTPALVTLATGVLAAIMAGFLSLKEIAELANAGTLAAFFAVALCMLILRFSDKDRPRLFRAPAGKVVAPLAMAGCFYLFVNLPSITVTRFLIWNAIGIVVYFVYSRVHSKLAVAAGFA